MFAHIDALMCVNLNTVILLMYCVYLGIKVSVI